MLLEECLCWTVVLQFVLGDLTRARVCKQTPHRQENRKETCAQEHTHARTHTHTHTPCPLSPQATVNESFGDFSSAVNSDSNATSLNNSLNSSGGFTAPHIDNSALHFRTLNSDLGEMCIACVFGMAFRDLEGTV